jgi:hypothetical protein
VSRALELSLILGCLALGGCDGCGRDDAPRRSVKQVQQDECSTAADCDDGERCTENRCENGRCVAWPVPAETSCDNDTVCDGISRCDGKGRCVAGTPLAIDDGNACTLDRCDPVTGVIHEPVPVDDFDECTRDACDPVSGRITHESVTIDDGDDCTFDSCDPREGVKHQRPSSFHTCAAGCGPGFHAASRARNAQCGRDALQTFCAPACGSAFHSCDAACPAGYHASSRAANAQCGGADALQSFCQKNGGSSFYTCEERCPDGYRLQSAGPGARCGPAGATRKHCVAL